MTDQDRVLSSIATGELVVSRIGSVGVAKGANPAGVASAMRAKHEAQEYARAGLQEKQRGRYSSALQLFMNSLAIEDDIGDFFGMASDLGNLADVYRLGGNPEKALVGFERALAIDEELARSLPALYNSKRVPDATQVQELGEANYMRALHFEGKARCLMDLGREGIDGALRQALAFYNDSDHLDSVKRIKQLLDGQ